MSRMRFGLLAMLVAAATTSAAAAPAAVQFVNDRVSATFEATPVPEAVRAIKAATGVELVMPASVQNRTITLAAQGLPLERFLQRFLGALEVGGYALVYEPGATGTRVLVVERGMGKSPPPAVSASPPGGAAITAVPSPAPAMAGPAGPGPASPPAHVAPVTRIEPNGIAILSRGTHERLVLTVSGPEGLRVQREFPAGGPAFFSAVDDQGQPLPDGGYGYEVTVVPALGQQVRARMEAARESPDARAALHAQLRREGWLPAQPLTRSGNFSIANGVILIPHSGTDGD